MSKTPISNGRTFIASPNLALIKYWGKSNRVLNLPATPSLGITLGGLETETTVAIAGSKDRVIIEEAEQDPGRFAQFFDEFRKRRKDARFFAVSRNSFPTAAGLASSSSGFAALACGCSAAAGLSLTPRELSAHARIGSASAARSLFGGFVALDANAAHAEQLYGQNHWPDLRVVLVAVRSEKKSISSRNAMELSRTSSPFYETWVSSSVSLFKDGCDAVDARDIEKLGVTIRKSYLRMFATMFSASPPVIYWHPDSLRMIKLCEGLRLDGVQAWETMDAGPQVKVLCLAGDVEAIQERIAAQNRDWTVFVSPVGPGPREK